MRKRRSLCFCWLTLLLGLRVCLVCAWDFRPLELPDPPVNGTDQTAAPEALKGIHGFGDRPANKLVEHAGSLALADHVEGIETPHTDWIGTYSEGPVRVLWVVDNPRYSARSPLEIRQRSDFDITLLMIPQDYRAYPDDKGMHRYFSTRYDEILARDYDVIVMSGYDPYVWRKNDLHPVIASVYERLDRKVRDGCGLICRMANGSWHQINQAGVAAFHERSPITYGPAPQRVRPVRTGVESPISDGISFAAWPDCAVGESRVDDDAVLLVEGGGRPMVATRSYGEGRVVAIHYVTPLRGAVGLVPETDGETHPRYGDDYEAVYPLWLRALAWAGRKAPRVGLHGPDVSACAAGSTPTVEITVTDPDSLLEAAVLRYRLIDAYGDVVTDERADIDVAQGQGSVTPDLPVLHAAGAYRLDLWLEAGGKTWNWGTVGVRVDGGAMLAVSRVEGERTPGATVAYRVRTDSRGSLWVLGVDGFDRIFCDRRLDIDGERTVELDTAGSQLPANRIFFTLLADDGDTVLARTADTLYLPRIGLDALDGQYMIAAYGNTLVSDHLKPHLGLLFRTLGFDTVHYNWHNRERLKAASDQGMHNIAGRSWYFNQKGFSKIHKLTPNDPANRDKWRSQIAELAKDVNAYGGIGRVTDEEHWFAYAGYDKGEWRGAQLTQDKWSLDLFREAMREKYGAIDALNEEWGTDFAGFAEVRVIEEDEVLGKDNPAGWVEFREYMNWTYANRYFGWLTEQHQALIDDDYGAGAGPPHWSSAQGGPVYRGGDMGKLQGNMNFMMLYGGGSPGSAFVGQPGGQKYDPPAMWKDYGAWKHVLTGADGLWYYFADAIVGSELAWRRHAEWIQEGIGDVIRGCGALLSGAQPAGSEMRVLSTPENLHMAWLFAKREDAWNTLGLSGGQPQGARTFRGVMGTLFAGTGGMSEDRIVDGGLANCKLLMLPQQVNLSDAAAEAIREYVRAGGFLVADIMPATRTRMGKPRAQSALADVFGVDVSKARIHKERESWFSVGVESPTDAETVLSRELIWLPGQVSFLDIEPTTSVPHAKILSKEGQENVGFFVNHYGTGQALLLNVLYADMDDETMAYHLAFGKRLLEWAGVETPFRIVDPITRQPLPYRPLYRLTRGKATLLGSLRGSHRWRGPNVVMVDPGRLLSVSDDAMFTWPGESHIYNVRTREYLGFGDSATIDLPSYKGRLLCLLPYKVQAVEVDAPSEAAQGERVAIHAAVQTDGEVPGEHVIYFEVVSPTGTRRPLYCKTRTAPDGKAGLELPFAFNDPEGEWTLTASDVMSGVKTVRTLHLRRQ